MKRHPGRLRRSRLSLCQRKAWGGWIALMRSFGGDPEIVLPYWGNTIYRLPRPAWWRRRLSERESRKGSER